MFSLPFDVIAMLGLQDPMKLATMMAQQNISPEVLQQGLQANNANAVGNMAQPQTPETLASAMKPNFPSIGPSSNDMSDPFMERTGVPQAPNVQVAEAGNGGNVQQIISDAASKYGVDPDTMLTIADLESGFNPNAQNPDSSAGGLFQFIDSTADDYGLVDKFDPYASADAAARLARDNKELLTEVLGRAPTKGELYLAHQQGGSGAAGLLSNPSKPAVNVVGLDQVKLNGGRPDMLSQDFAGLWVNKANSRGQGTDTTVQPPRLDPNVGSSIDFARAEGTSEGTPPQAGQELSDQSNVGRTTAGGSGNAIQTAASKAQELAKKLGEIGKSLKVPEAPPPQDPPRIGSVPQMGGNPTPPPVDMQTLFALLGGSGAGGGAAIPPLSQLIKGGR